jgi:hypothetical protein
VAGGLALVLIIVVGTAGGIALVPGASSGAALGIALVLVVIVGAAVGIALVPGARGGAAGGIALVLAAIVGASRAIALVPGASGGAAGRVADPIFIHSVVLAADLCDQQVQQKDVALVRFHRRSHGASKRERGDVC